MIIWAITLNTFREVIRNKILYSVLLFGVLVIGGSAVFANVSVGNPVNVIQDFGLFSLSLCGAILSIVSGVNLLNKELKQKTIYNVLSKPVERWQFVVGKFFGLGLTVSLLTALMAVALVILLAAYGGAELRLFQALGFVLLEVWIISAITIFFSSVVITTTLTGLFTIGTYIAGHSISYLTYFLEMRDLPRPVMGLVKFLDIVLPDLSLFNVNDLVVGGIDISASRFLFALLYTAGYSGVLLVLAGVIFRRREFQ